MIPKPVRDSSEKERLAANPAADAITLPAEVIESPSRIDAEEEIAGRQRMVIRLRNVWNRRQTIVRLTWSGFILSALAAFLIPRRYASSARLMPPDQSNSGSGLAMLAAASGNASSNLGSLAGGILGLKSSGALFIGILQSRTVRDDIVSRLQLQKVYGDRYAEDARNHLAANSDVYEDRRSGIITIEVTDTQPRRAAAITQEYTEELNRVVNQMSTSSAHREREFLEERLKSVQADLEGAEKEFSQFASKNGTIDIQTQGKAMIEGAATLQGKLIAAESELQGLKQIYTDDNVRVRSVRAQMAELKSQLGKIGGQNESTDSADRAQGDPNYPSIRKLPLLGVAYADLYRRTKVQEAVFETLTREYELAKVQEVKETPSVKVLDAASVPEKKSYPPRLLIISLGSVSAFVAGMIWMVLRTLWEETDPEDPRREFALEVYRGTAAQLSWQSINGSLLNLAQRGFRMRCNGQKNASQEHVQERTREHRGTV
jgi:uncharacterized protein involved in exopolysaccharide biosynthesis